MIHETIPPPDRRQRQRGRRAAHFLDAAQRVVEREGVAALTIGAVADEADAAIGTLYRYFDGKEALLAALQVRAILAFEQHLVEATRDVACPVDRLRAASRAWRTFAQVEPSAFVLLDTSLSDPDQNLTDPAARAVEAALRPALGRIAASFFEAQARGLLSPGDPLLRTYVLWAAVHGASHFRKRDRLGGPSAEAVAEAAVEGLIAGWRG